MDATVAPVSTWAPWATSSSLHQDGQLGVERGQHLGGGLDDGDVDALAHQVLGHLQADEAGPDDDGRLGGDADVGGQAGGVLDGAQRAGALIARDGRPHRGGAHAQHQLVVGQDLLLARQRRAGRDRVRRPVDGDDLVVDPHVEAEPGKELLGRLQGEVVLFFDQPADEIGQAAVGERDVAGPLEHGDLGVGVKAAQAGCRRHAPGDTADDDDPSAPARYRVARKSHRAPTSRRSLVGPGLTPYCSAGPEASRIGTVRREGHVRAPARREHRTLPKSGRPHCGQLTAEHIPPRVPPERTGPATSRPVGHWRFTATPMVK